MKPLRMFAPLLLALVAVLCIAPQAWGFCGFYVAKADTKLYNNASQVAIARDGNRTVLTMANDFQGDVKDFAVVVPVPVVLQKGQVNVGNPQILERLDAFSAPRLVEYYDPDPCNVGYLQKDEAFRGSLPASAPAASEARRQDSLGVTVEARFSVGEYDILILSAKESNGLETWLIRNGYKIPQGARQLLQPYIRQNMKFFVAKVNLAAYQKAGYKFLRPLQMAYESPKFMLPIRLGMVNAAAAQDLVVYILSPRGQAEVTNYRTVNIPSDTEIPLFVKNEFGKFYKAMFQTAYNQEGQKAVFLEYAWDMANCDPCSAQPLTPEELRQAGVFWLNTPERNQRGISVPRFRTPAASGVFITRLHVRYTRAKFPEDLVFHETANRRQFQGRYVMNHPFKGDLNCPAGRQYQRSLSARFEREAQNLARLTRWQVQEIRSKMGYTPTGSEPWWKNLWP